MTVLSITLAILDRQTTELEGWFADQQMGPTNSEPEGYWVTLPAERPVQLMLANEPAKGSCARCEGEWSPTGCQCIPWGRESASYQSGR